MRELTSVELDAVSGGLMIAKGGCEPRPICDPGPVRLEPICHPVLGRPVFGLIGMLGGCSCGSTARPAD
jgi:hypothetical protein